MHSLKNILNISDDIWRQLKEMSWEIWMSSSVNKFIILEGPIKQIHKGKNLLIMYEKGQFIFFQWLYFELQPIYLHGSMKRNKKISKGNKLWREIWALTDFHASKQRKKLFFWTFFLHSMFFQFQWKYIFNNGNFNR